MSEVAYTVAWIGADEARAQAWLDHDDPTHSFRDLRGMIRDVLTARGNPDPELQTQVEYRVYRQLCWAKHANPLLESRFGVEVSVDEMVIANGPDVTESGIRAGWFALEHSAAFALIAAASFFDTHAHGFCTQERADHLEAIMDSIGTRRKKLEAAAIARWGNVDPFPGRW